MENIKYIIPGEFEKSSFILLSWPVYDYLKEIKNNSIILNIMKLILLNTNVNIKIIINYNEEEKEIKENLKNIDVNIDINRIKFYIIKHNEIWMRDIGPIYCKKMIQDNDCDLKENKKIIGIKFNFWGYEENGSLLSKTETNIKKKIAEYENIEYIDTNIISEGGNIESNGKGILMMNMEVELDRNKNMNIEEIENEYKKILYIEKIIWIPYSSCFDDKKWEKKIPGQKKLYVNSLFSTQGHIDGFARFISENTILYEYEEFSKKQLKKKIYREEQFRLNENLKVLQKATDTNGNNFKLIKMISCPLIYKEISTNDNIIKQYISNTNNPDIFTLKNYKYKKIFAIVKCSYINFLICNNIIICNSCWHEGLDINIKEYDNKAMEILQNCFPDKKIFFINVIPANISGGGIHCLTMQEYF